MIVLKTHTYPGLRNGYLCIGKVVSAGTGIITIDIPGPDYSAKITGLVLTPVHNEAAKLCVVQITSIAYDTATAKTNILGRVFVSDDIADPAFSLTDDIVVNYQFWINEASLPTDMDTNSLMTEQDY